MRNTKLVIFDCDGVLVDSEPIANAVFALHLRKIGLPYTTEQAINRFMGRSMKSCMVEVLDDLQALGVATSKDFPSAFLAALQADTFAAFEKSLKPVLGITDAINAIEAAGVKTCIASSGDHAKMKVTLGLCGLYDRFLERIFSATQVQNGKPAPDLFLFAAAQMGFKPIECTVVEDSPAGVQAAVAAGMRVVGYTALTSPQAITGGEGVEHARSNSQVTLISRMQDLPAAVL